MNIIANCNQKGCPKDWKKLETSGETHIGLCLECFRKVTLVETIEDLNVKLSKHIKFIDSTYEGLKNPIEAARKWLRK